MPVRTRFLEHYRKADRIMLALIWLMFVFSLGLAFWHDTLIESVIVGGGTSVVLTVAYRALGGSRLMRCLLGAGLMVMAALHINQAQGVIESHFGIFALLAVLTFYRHARQPARRGALCAGQPVGGRNVAGRGR